MEEIEQPKIVEKEVYGDKFFVLELPKNWHLNWAYFHKLFRQADGKTEEESKKIANFYKAYQELPDWVLECAEENLLEVYYDEN